MVVLKKGFSYIKKQRDFFSPKTPVSALRAVEQGVLPAEAFVYKASSVKPLYEEPFDREEIQRVLSRQDIDIETLLLIITILNRLILSRDSETALFAAESLNEIENRFTSRINKLRGRLKKEKSVLLYRELGLTCFDLARITTENRTIRNFYLKEAFSNLYTVTRMEGREEEDHIYLVKICINLKLHAQAEQIISEIRNIYRDSEELKMLQAENEFYRKNFVRVIEIAREFSPGSLSAAEHRIIDFWRGYGE